MTLCVLFSGASAQSTHPTSAPTTKPDPAAVTTDHQITIAGKPIHYKATAGTITLKSDDGKPRATMFFVSYSKSDPTPDPSARPITYIFNGGPGAASVWLHLGAVGPRRISLNPDGSPPAPPYHLVDNDQTWLDLTDLVFIDPVGTGFSRPAEGVKADQFFGVDPDIATVAEFIRLYTTKYERWSSPKFLAGESYGTTRAAGLSEYLLDHTGIALNGILFISTVLDFSTLHIDDNNTLPYALNLPTYTAAAWYHKRLSANLQSHDLQTLVRDAQHWSLSVYLPALLQGDKLPNDTRKQIISQLSQYTSLSPALIEQQNFRIGPSFFEKHLLADQRQIIGRFDSRLTGYSTDTEEPWPEYDPSLSLYYPLYTSTFNDYIRRELKYESDLTYEVLSPRVGPWNFGQEGGGYLNVATRLRSALAKNPHMKLLFAAGFYDLATPFATVDYTIDHLNLSPELRKNITQTYYPAGHMLYHPHASLIKLKSDLAPFFQSATTRPAQDSQ
ncbi:MAG TPA: hypothetical protein VFE58_01855 [Tepidisphaeraceae bacterium]|nr:hypothetical protein [Tepidisphaeraceae bacterium]